MGKSSFLRLLPLTILPSVKQTIMQHYNDFARKVFANEPNIKVFRSSFCMNRIKYSTKITLAEKPGQVK